MTQQSKPSFLSILAEDRIALDAAKPPKPLCMPRNKHLTNNNTINNPILRSYVDPIFEDESIYLKRDPSGIAGFICLTCDRQDCQTKDLDLFEGFSWKLGAEGLKVPDGTIAVILATEGFTLPCTESADLQLKDHLLEPVHPELENGEWKLNRLTNRIACIECWFGEEKVLAGLLIEPARIGEEDCLVEEEGSKKKIKSLMRNGDEECNDYVERCKDDQYPAPADPESELQDFKVRVPVSFPKFPDAPFLPERVMYHTICSRTLVDVYAYLSINNDIEVVSHDKFGTPKWTWTTCKDSTLQVQRAVRKLGYTEEFYMEEYPELSFAPPADAIKKLPELPENAPFTIEQVLCIQDFGGAEKHFLIMKADGLLAFYTYNSKKTWRARVPKNVFYEMKYSVRARGILNEFCDKDTVSYVRMVEQKGPVEVEPVPVYQTNEANVVNITEQLGEAEAETKEKAKTEAYKKFLERSVSVKKLVFEVQKNPELPFYNKYIPRYVPIDAVVHSQATSSTVIVTPRSIGTCTTTPQSSSLSKDISKEKKDPGTELQEILAKHRKTMEVLREMQKESREKASKWRAKKGTFFDK